ncbi:uncharacterized protein [Musca autumnalis]|uniref:uncharacterized protein n=1 Tax=Musca autumnalis TaxID=221902 RepID=UPI003CE85F4C
MTHFQEKQLLTDNNMNSSATNQLRRQQRRFSYQLLIVALIANLAIGLSADLDNEDLPKDLWCSDVTEFCNRYLDLPRPECIAKLNEICIEEPKVQQNGSVEEQKTKDFKPFEEVPSKPDEISDEDSPNDIKQDESGPPQWLLNMVEELFNPENKLAK